MIADESSSDLNDFRKDVQAKGAIPKRNSLNTIESEQNTIGCKREISNFRLSRSKYANLINQTDIKWWTNIKEKRIEAGKDDTNEQPEAESVSKENAIIQTFSYVPVICPVADCKVSFLPNDMISHFLSYHIQKTSIHRLFEKQRLLIEFQPFELNTGEINCLGLISYAGKKSSSKADNLWLSQNLKLCQSSTLLMNDYPIFMLASIMPMDVFLKPKVECDGDSICASMLVLWLAGNYRNANISYKVTAFNEALSISRSGIYDVRVLTKSECPYEFCSKDCNYFRLTLKELNSLLRNEKTLIIELIFHGPLEK